MSNRCTECRAWTEIFIAVAAGMVFALACPQWFDPDEVIEVHWCIVLFGVGLAFGVFGRCPVLLIGPAFTFVAFVLSLSDLWLFETVFAGVLCLFVLIGAVTGRGASRFWKKRRARYAVQPGAPPSGGPATPSGNSGVAEVPPSVS